MAGTSTASTTGTFAVLDHHTVAHLDLTGSGVETIAHLRENGRIVVMFCAFHGSPRIVRLYGRGEPALPGDPLMRSEGERPQLDEWAERKGPAGIARYQAEKNATSSDGLRGLPPPADVSRAGVEG